MYSMDICALHIIQYYYGGVGYRAFRISYVRYEIRFTVNIPLCRSTCTSGNWILGNILHTGYDIVYDKTTTPPRVGFAPSVCGIENTTSTLPSAISGVTPIPSGKNGSAVNIATHITCSFECLVQQWTHRCYGLPHRIVHNRLPMHTRWSGLH